MSREDNIMNSGSDLKKNHNMKLAFSTIGCPGWSFGDIISAAKDLKFDGIEIRGIGKEVYAPKCVQFSKEKIDDTIAALGSKLKISCLTTGICLGAKEKEEAALKEAEDYAPLAAKLKVPYIRTMITDRPYPEETDVEHALKVYRMICDMFKEKAPDTKVLVETNGILADTSKMREFIEKAGRDNSGVLWDINHPVRFFNESVETTLQNIGEYVRYVHVKDSKVEDGKIVYRMMGYGDMPLFEALKALHQIGYDGYISLEWVKRWLPELQEPGIVFAQYISYMSYLLTMI